MAIQDIGVKYAGGFHAIDQVFVQVAGELRRVVTIWVKEQGQLRLVYTLIPNPPGSFRAGEVFHTSVSLYWDHPLPAKSTDVEAIEILRRDADASLTTRKDAPAKVIMRITPKNLPTNWRDGWFTDTSITRRSHYVYTARSVNIFKGLEFYSEESANAVHVFTGQNATYSTSVGVTGANKDGIINHQFQPVAADTWTPKLGWDSRTNARPAQGILRDRPKREEYNQRGCVDYSSAYNRMVTLYGYVDIEDAHGNVVTSPIADHIRVTRAWIQAITRMANDGGPPAADLRLRSGLFSIGGRATDQPRALPVTPPGLTPEREASKTVSNLKVGTPNRQTVEIDNWWADDWIRKPSIRQKNGLLMYREDGDDLCVIAGVSGDDAKNYVQCLDLILEYKWNIKTRPELAPFHEKYNWPL